MIDRSTIERMLADAKMLAPYLDKPISEFEPSDVLLYVELLRRCTKETHEEQIERLTEHLALRSIVEAQAQHPPVYWPRLGMIACADCGAELRSNTDTTAHFLACSHRRAVELLGVVSHETPNMSDNGDCVAPVSDK